MWILGARGKEWGLEGECQKKVLEDREVLLNQNGLDLNELHNIKVARILGCIAYELREA